MANGLETESDEALGLSLHRTRTSTRRGPVGLSLPQLTAAPQPPFGTHSWGSGKVWIWTGVPRQLCGDEVSWPALSTSLNVCVITRPPPPHGLAQEAAQAAGRSLCSRSERPVLGV